MNCVKERRLVSSGKNRGKFSQTLALVKKDYIIYIMLLPFVLWYLLFVFKPMGGLMIAFKDYNLFKGIAASPWIGFDNFAEFLSGPYFGRLIRNTFIIGVYGIIFTFPSAIIFALMLNEIKCQLYKRTVQTLMYAPYFISTVVVCGMITNMLSPTTGVVNAIIKALGGDEIYFLSQPQYFRTIFILMRIWKTCGNSAIIYIAALSSIDMQLYEACMVDGGNKYHQLRHVTIPGIMPTIVVMLILNVGSMFTVSSEAIILLYQPSTYETADVISTYVYRAGLTGGDYGVATAVGLFEGVIGLTLVLISNKISKRVSDYSAF